jgi:hypothetical protein
MVSLYRKLQYTLALQSMVLISVSSAQSYSDGGSGMARWRKRKMWSIRMCKSLCLLTMIPWRPRADRRLSQDFTRVTSGTPLSPYLVYSSSISSLSSSIAECLCTSALAGPGERLLGRREDDVASSLSGRPRVRPHFLRPQLAKSSPGRPHDPMNLATRGAERAVYVALQATIADLIKGWEHRRVSSPIG